MIRIVVVAMLLLQGCSKPAPPSAPVTVPAKPPIHACVDFKGDGVGVMTPEDLQAKYTSATNFRRKGMEGIETWIVRGKREPSLTIATQPINKAVYRFLDGRLAEITIYGEESAKAKEVQLALRDKYGPSSSGDDLFAYWDIDGDCYVKSANLSGNAWFGSTKMKAEFDRRERAALDASADKAREAAAKDL